jgi:glutathione reductase (NADPH)
VEKPAFSWSTLLARKDVEIARLNQVYHDLLVDAGVELIAGRAEFSDAHTVCVADRTLRARNVLIATGSIPHMLDVPGHELAISSDHAFHLERLPKRVVLVGGGYIALEFAGIFHALGSEVRIVHHGDQILRGFDREVRDHLARELRAQGIAIDCTASVRSLRRSSDGIAVEIDGAEHDVAETVMFATGRTPNTSQLGLSRAGVTFDARGAIWTDDHCRSSVSHIFAVGDCLGTSGLTPVAIAQGQAVAQTLFGQGAPPRVALDHVATAVFSQPAVATVGLPEHEARERYAHVTTYRSLFTPLKHRLTGRARKNLVKIVVDAERDRVVGCHVVGADAAEIIQGFAVALQLGVTKAQLDSVIAVHPTAAEELVTLR